MVLCGATSVFGFSKIKNSFSSLGIDVRFADVPFMKPFAWNEDEPLEFVQDICDEEIIPLTEYWISRCIKNGNCRISDNALKASRDKKFLYEFLSSKKISVPKIYSSKEEALAEIHNGKKIIVKPASLNSGYGIEVVDEKNVLLLDKYIFQASTLKNHAMEIMQVENKGALLTEKICGIEYSADCFVNGREIKVLRLCEKIITLVHDKPCCLVYFLLNPSEKKELCDEIKKWCLNLFDETDLSFAQFDFICNDDGIFPIDFAPRVGGGMKDLLFESGTNPYAFENNYKINNLVQFNYLPTFSGKLNLKDVYFIPGKLIQLKKDGDWGTNNPSSASSRIATVLTPFDKEKITPELLNSLLIRQ